MGGAVGQADFFQFGDMEQVIGDDGIGDAPQIKPLTTADDGGEDFLWVGGGEDEFCVGGRFFQHFEQSVERLH